MRKNNEVINTIQSQSFLKEEASDGMKDDYTSEFNPLLTYKLGS